MEKALEELTKKLKKLKFRIGKANDIAKRDRGLGKAMVIARFLEIYRNMTPSSESKSRKKSWRKPLT